MKSRSNLRKSRGGALKAQIEPRVSSRKKAESLSERTVAVAGSTDALARRPQATALTRSDTNKLEQLPPRSSKTEMRLFEKAQPTCIGSAAYIYLSAKLALPPELMESTAAASMMLLEEMGARDALERLALSQVLLAHGRAAWLTKALTTQTDPNSVRAMSEACERATGNFVRLMRGFAEYRRPVNAATNVSIAQANLAKQQIVQAFIEGEGPGKKHDEQNRITQRLPVIIAALPANPKRAALPAACDPTNQTVDKKYRTENSGRKTPGRDECVKARRTISRRTRVKKTDGSND